MENQASAKNFMGIKSQKKKQSQEIKQQITCLATLNQYIYIICNVSEH